ncbi:MAG: HpcH/HpaI aldolase/citrate lyase family protein [Pseudomonadota bacterium]
MPPPKNPFKAALAQDGPPLLGIWLSLAAEGNAEALAGTSADWLCVDSEHAPLDLDLLRRLLTAGQKANALVARVPINETWVIKTFMDAGTQTLIVPMVDTVEQAKRAADAMRFPPDGNRGAAGGSRAADYGRIKDYLTTANQEVCTIIQIESPEAVSNIEAMAEVPGIDGMFIGPNDLAVTHGYPGPSHPDVEKLIEQTIGRINAAGKASAILSFDPEAAKRYIGYGARFVCVGSDTNLLTGGAERLLAGFR